MQDYYTTMFKKNIKKSALKFNIKTIVLFYNMYIDKKPLKNSKNKNVKPISVD